MIDSHAHIISEFYNDIDTLIKELKEKNVKKVINCSTSINDIQEVLDLSKKYKNFLYPAIGIHPENFKDIDKMNLLEDYIKENKVAAIGEIGLDYYWTKDNKELQKELFKKQLNIAEKYNLPVIIHTRDSIQDTYDILKQRNLKGIIHCYSGSIEMAKEFIKLGFLIGIGGVLTFKNSKLHQIIEEIGLENIVLETDSPFLTPEPNRGKKNDPSHVYFVAQKLSEIINKNIEEIIKITNENLNKVFNLN